MDTRLTTQQNDDRHLVLIFHLFIFGVELNGFMMVENITPGEIGSPEFGLYRLAIQCIRL